MDINELRHRSSKAFDAEFRDRICNAVQLHILNGGEINTATYRISRYIDCRCPEGCLVNSQHPNAYYMKNVYGFTYDQHRTFQIAFDSGIDENSPEAALGLLYRLRFIK